jgi:DNA-binding response OmpR family regulator
MPSDERVLLLSMGTAGRNRLAAQITKLGYAVTAAESLAAAQAPRDRQAFPIVILDTDDPAAIVQLRAQLPGSALIAIGARRLADALAAWHAGAGDYLARPVRRNELASALERAHARLPQAADQQAPLSRSGSAEFRRMAAELAQQINTPLTPILGMADLLAEDLLLDHPSREYARAISEAALRIREVTWMLADLAQQGG